MALKIMRTRLTRTTALGVVTEMVETDTEEGTRRSDHWSGKLFRSVMWDARVSRIMSKCTELQEWWLGSSNESTNKMVAGLVPKFIGHRYCRNGRRRSGRDRRANGKANSSCRSTAQEWETLGSNMVLQGFAKEKRGMEPLNTNMHRPKRR